MSTKQTFKTTFNDKKVFVGLSGGVDSAVSTALLKEEGYDVTGVFIKVWSPDFLTCTWREERRDAMRVAAHLDIPFLFFDFEDEYKRGVADYMIAEYKAGRTPNPDVMCNKVVKFGAFWQKAKEMGADYIATGHYAISDGEHLREGHDGLKDQSYFLWTLTKQDLSHILFPVGKLEKSSVRNLAEKFKLPVSAKKDSQGICFLGDVDIEEFLSHFIDLKAGDVLDSSGKMIGTHNGALLYTLGQRHGFEITKKTTNSKRYFVIERNIEDNTITVSDNSQEIAEHSKRSLFVDTFNWIQEPITECLARIRYRQDKFKVTIKSNEIIFDSPQTVAPGQSIVFYENDECLGGAIIK